MDCSKKLHSSTSAMKPTIYKDNNKVVIYKRIKRATFIPSQKMKQDLRGYAIDVFNFAMFCFLQLISGSDTIFNDNNKAVKLVEPFHYFNNGIWPKLNRWELLKNEAAWLWMLCILTVTTNLCYQMLGVFVQMMNSERIMVMGAWHPINYRN